MEKIDQGKDLQKLQGTYKTLAEDYRTKKPSNPEDIKKYKDFGHALIGYISNFRNNKNELSSALSEFINITPELENKIDEYLKNPDTGIGNWNETAKLILASKPSIVIQISTKAAQKELIELKQTILLFHNENVFDEADSEYSFLHDQEPLGDEFFEYKVINHLSAKKPYINFSDSNGSIEAKFNAGGRGEVDISIIGKDGATHQNAATTADFSNVIFETDQVRRHWFVEQKFNQDNPELMKNIISAKSVEDAESARAKMLEIREDWQREQVLKINENEFVKSGGNKGKGSLSYFTEVEFQRRFYDKFIDDLIESDSLNEETRIGKMIYSPEFPEEVSKFAANLQYSQSKNTEAEKRVLLGIVLEYQVGDLQVYDKTQKGIDFLSEHVLSVDTTSVANKNINKSSSVLVKFSETRAAMETLKQNIPVNLLTISNDDIEKLDSNNPSRKLYEAVSKGEAVINNFAWMILHLCDIDLDNFDATDFKQPSKEILSTQTMSSIRMVQYLSLFSRLMAKDKDFRIGYFKENQKQYDFYKRLVKSEYIYEDELGNIEYADDPLEVLYPPGLLGEESTQKTNQKNKSPRKKRRNDRQP